LRVVVFSEIVTDSDGELHDTLRAGGGGQLTLSQGGEMGELVFGEAEEGGEGDDGR
jgi:hypothetical protein